MNLKSQISNLKSLFRLIAFSLQPLAFSIFLVGCTNPSGGPALDEEVTNAPTAGTLSQVVGTNLDNGLVLTFPSQIPADVLGKLNSAGALVVSNKAVIGPLTGQPVEQTAIRAAVGAGATITGVNLPTPQRSTFNPQPAP